MQLLAVSKRHDCSKIQQAIDAGQTAFGENYLQEALDKIQYFSDCQLQWHFIGPIQSNKTRKLAEHFDWVHTVDRLKIAQRLSEQRPADLAPLNICLQVNVSEEGTKSGLLLHELNEVVPQVIALPNLCLRGLMAIPAPAAGFEQQRVPFQQLREALQQLNQQYQLNLDTLSMGMSDDMEAAIAEGATIVRVGTAIFGQRLT